MNTGKGIHPVFRYIVYHRSSRIGIFQPGSGRLYVCNIGFRRYANGSAGIAAYGLDRHGRQVELPYGNIHR